MKKLVFALLTSAFVIALALPVLAQPVGTYPPAVNDVEGDGNTDVDGDGIENDQDPDADGSGSRGQTA